MRRPFLRDWRQDGSTWVRLLESGQATARTHGTRRIRQARIRDTHGFRDQPMVARATMQETFFATRLAQLRDRFGINWMIVHERQVTMLSRA